MPQSLESIRSRRLPPLREDVYKALLQAIFSGQLSTGQHLVEGEIARQLGVSRTPVREAVRRLESEGLVNVDQGRGLKVIDISDDRIREIFAVRESLECVAVIFTVERVTKEEIRRLERIVAEGLEFAYRDDTAFFLKSVKQFNKEFVETSKAQNLIKIIYNYHEYVHCLRLRSLAGRERRIEAAREHAAMLEAVKQGESELAKEIIHQHIQGAHEYYKSARGVARDMEDAEASLMSRVQNRTE
ncbi:MAG: GntR family transcriptional regulator [Synergistales bacterium]|nr:GntR family transcriptional regulator [Synergistales bacterium]